MITERLRQLAGPIIEPIARSLHRLGVSANALTVLGGLLHVVAGIVVALGGLRPGAVVLAIAAACDALDGAVARSGKGTTPFGAFLDSTMDRLSEILVFAGLMWFFLQSQAAPDGRASPLGALLVLLALSGSLMVSYTRARSEGIGCPTKAGWFGRFERMVILVLALLANAPQPGLLIIGVGAWLTAGLRVLDVHRNSR